VRAPGAFEAAIIHPTNARLLAAIPLVSEAVLVKRLGLRENGAMEKRMSAIQLLGYRWIASAWSGAAH